MNKTIFGIVAIVLTAFISWNAYVSRNDKFESEAYDLIGQCFALGEGIVKKSLVLSAEEIPTVFSQSADKLYSQYDANNPLFQPAKKFCEQELKFVEEQSVKIAMITGVNAERYSNLETIKSESEWEWRKLYYVNAKEALLEKAERIESAKRALAEALSNTGLPEEMKVELFKFIRAADNSTGLGDEMYRRKLVKLLDARYEFLEFLFEQKETYEYKNKKYLFESEPLLAKFNALAKNVKHYEHQAGEANQRIDLLNRN